MAIPRKSDIENWWRQLTGAPVQLARFEAVRGTASYSQLLFSGAFNPLHAGHQQMADMAEQTIGRKLHFELPVVNADKPPLDCTTTCTRLQQDFFARSVWISNAATFVDKSRLYPGTTFVIGADTLQRIIDPKFYPTQSDALIAAFDQISAAGCSFLVFARRVGGQVVSLEAGAWPTPLLRLCRSIPANEFLFSVSSSEIRRKSGER